MALLRRYFPDKEVESPILYEISTDMVQQLVEANYDRELSEVEIARVHFAMFEEFDELVNFIMNSVEGAIDNREGYWDWLDKQTKARKKLYKLGNYWIGEDNPVNKPHLPL